MGNDNSAYMYNRLWENSDVMIRFIKNSTAIDKVRRDEMGVGEVYSKL